MNFEHPCQYYCQQRNGTCCIVHGWLPKLYLLSKVTFVARYQCYKLYILGCKVLVVQSVEGLVETFCWRWAMLSDRNLNFCCCLLVRTMMHQSCQFFCYLSRGNNKCIFSLKCFFKEIVLFAIQILIKVKRNRYV